MENSRTQRFIFGLLSLLWDTLFFGCLLFTTILQKNPCASSGIATVLSLTRKRSLRRSLRILWSPWSLEQERSNCMQFWPFFDVARITVWFVECQRSYGFDGWWPKQNWTAWLIPRTLFVLSACFIVQANRYVEGMKEAAPTFKKLRGAESLTRFFFEHGVKQYMATSTPRSLIGSKLAPHKVCSVRFDLFPGNDRPLRVDRDSWRC